MADKLSMMLDQLGDALRASKKICYVFSKDCSYLKSVQTTDYDKRIKVKNDINFKTKLEGFLRFGGHIN